MSKEEILFLRNVLLDRRSSVLERVQRLAAAWLELEERAIELEEEAQKASIAKPYDKLDENGKIEIEQIDMALAKMSLGDYGVCESCGDDIAPEGFRPYHGRVFASSARVTSKSSTRACRRRPKRSLPGRSPMSTRV